MVSGNVGWFASAAADGVQKETKPSQDTGEASAVPEEPVYTAKALRAKRQKVDVLTSKNSDCMPRISSLWPNPSARAQTVMSSISQATMISTVNGKDARANVKEKPLNKAHCSETTKTGAIAATSWFRSALKPTHQSPSSCDTLGHCACPKRKPQIEPSPFKTPNVPTSKTSSRTWGLSTSKSSTCAAPSSSLSTPRRQVVIYRPPSTASSRASEGSVDDDCMSDTRSCASSRASSRTWGHISFSSSTAGSSSCSQRQMVPYRDDVETSTRASENGFDFDDMSDTNSCTSSTRFLVNKNIDGYVTIGGEAMSINRLKHIKKEQRNSKGLYSSKLFFPSGFGANAAHDQQSILMAPKYICFKNYKCTDGACASRVPTYVVGKLREGLCRRLETTKQTFRDVLLHTLLSAWNANVEKFNSILLQISPVESIEVCVTAWALIHGISDSMLQEEASKVTSGMALEDPMPETNQNKNKNERRSLDLVMLREYCRELVFLNEMNPAPGTAKRAAGETMVTKKSWNQKWEQCQSHFKANNITCVPGSMHIFKKAWRLETRLRERVSKSHSKCDICAGIDAKLYALRGNNTAEAKKQRGFLQRMQMDHEKKHLHDRSILDTAGYRAFLRPHEIWTFLCDAATERTYTIPRFVRRVKAFSSRPFFNQKLMSVYAYGFGFFPYLVHDSQTFGANLTWTVLWESMTVMRMERGYWPEEIHITLDNTSGECKNKYMIAFCSWLVATGKVKRVRVFFLMVGHTHVIIDQIFGVIAVGLRGREILTPDALIKNVQTTCSIHPQWLARDVRTLECLYDITGWVDSGELEVAKMERLYRGQQFDEQGEYPGMYDFVLTPHSEYKVALNYREDCTYAWRPLDNPSGCQALKKLPDGPPKLAKIKPRKSWATSGTYNIEQTMTICARNAKTLSDDDERASMLAAWEAKFSSIPTIIELLPRARQLEFLFFDDVHQERLQLAHTPAEEEGEDEEYTRWKRANFNVRDAPLALDPVISSEQSHAEYEVRKKAMQLALRGGRQPTLDQLSLVFDSDLVLAGEEGQGVSLYKVETFAKGDTPTSVDITMFSVRYEHVLEEGRSGLTGTFRPAKDNGHIVKKALKRSMVVVYNVELTPRTNRLTLESLRMLARARPELYPVPDEGNAEEHLPQERAGGRKTGKRGQQPRGARRNVRGRATRVQASSSEDEESDDDEEDEDEDEDSDQEDAEEDDQDENDRDEPSQGAGLDLPRAGMLAGAFAPMNATPERGRACREEVGNGTILQEREHLAGCLVGMVVFVDMTGVEDCLQYKIPAIPALVCEDNDQKLKVRWYVPSWRRGHPPAKAKNVKYLKYWTNRNWLKIEKIKKKDQAPGALPRELVEKYWFLDTIDRSTILQIPFLKFDTQERLWKTDAIELTRDFYDTKIVPTARAHGCCHD